MNTIVELILVLYLGVDPNTNQPLFTTDQPVKEMTAEQCIEQATIINNDKDDPYTAVCSPKIGDRNA